MKLPKATASIFAISTIAALAACGGGGGGGVTPSNPGGAPPPVTGPTTAPTTSPTVSPSTSPTSSPTTSPTTSPTATPVPVSAQAIRVYNDLVLGDRSWYTSGTASWSNNSGDTSGAPTTTAAGMTCAQTQEPAASTSTYSQHAFVGIYFNGTIEALPQALGMVNPVAPIGTGNPPHTSNTQEVEQQQCEFNVHTHDYSGLVHVEDVSQAQSTSSAMPYATLQALFDVWGAQLTPAGITAGNSSLAGPVQIYAGTPSGKNSATGDDLVNSYTAVSGASTVQLAPHTAIWIVIGTPPQAGLPQIDFGVQN